MAADEMFDSSVRPSGDLAGVFEYDGDTAYFYLYKTESDRNQKVMGAIRIVCGKSDFEQTDLAVRWDASETKVGLFIRGQLCAAFDSGGTQYGGDYRKDVQAEIPPEVLLALLPSER